MKRHSALVWLCTQLLLVSVSADSSDSESEVSTKEYTDTTDSTIIICAGCPVAQNANDNEYLTLAQESIAKYQEDQSSEQYLKVLRVYNVTTQVVAGILTKIDLDASPTNCTLDDNEATSVCEVLDESDYITCHAKIWERAWLKKKEIEISCDDN